MSKFDSLIKSISSRLDESNLALLGGKEPASNTKLIPQSQELSKNFKAPNSTTSTSSTSQPNNNQQNNTQPNNDQQKKDQQNSNANLAELQKQLAQLQKDLEAGGEEMEQKAIVDKIANLQKLIAAATKTTTAS